MRSVDQSVEGGLSFGLSVIQTEMAFMACDTPISVTVLRAVRKGFRAYQRKRSHSSFSLCDANVSIANNRGWNVLQTTLCTSGGWPEAEYQKA